MTHRYAPAAFRLAALTAITMIAFAANSWLCRLALSRTTIDPATFTTVRLTCGAIMLSLLASRGDARAGTGNWRSAAALFGYAAAFSFAYRSLTAGTGALILFGAVQATMIAWDWAHGSGAPRPVQMAGVGLALAGLVGLVLPGLSAPPLVGSLLMAASGIAWGVYSLRGRGQGDPVRVNAGNFVRAALLAAVLSAVTFSSAVFDTTGLVYALISGAITSGIGYAVWYAVLPSLRPASAATIQLSVPLIAAVGGLFLLGESLSLRLVLAGAAILGGIALVIRDKGRER
jgi:drug/metabolite transporter (DMT)-like permease